MLLPLGSTHGLLPHSESLDRYGKALRGPSGHTNGFVLSFLVFPGDLCPSVEVIQSKEIPPCN